MPGHRIARQTLEIGVAEAAAAWPAMDEASAAAPALAAAIARACDRVARPGRVVRIERLVVDLGRCRAGELAARLPARLDAALDEPLRAAAARGSVDAGEDAAALLAAFARGGTLPWWAARDAAAALADAAAAPGLPAPPIRALIRDPAAAARLAAQLERAALVRLAAVAAGLAEAGVAALAPAAGETRAAAAARWAAILDVAATWIDSADEPAFAAAVRARAGEGGGERPRDDPATRARSAERGAVLPAVPGPDGVDDAARPNPDARVDPARGAVAGAEPSPGRPAPLREQPAHPTGSGATGRDAPSDPSEDFLPAGRSPRDRDTAANDLSASPGEAALAPERAGDDPRLADGPGARRALPSGASPRDLPARGAAMPALRENAAHAVADAGAPVSTPDQRPSLDPRDDAALPVVDAGVVLMWPFLPRLLRATGLRDEAHYLDALAPHRAALLLHHLATGARLPHEAALPLAKLLAGLSPDALLPPLDPLDDAEVAEAARLREAVAAQAAALGWISGEGLRRAFLARGGLLSAADGCWLLRVEPRTEDVLLERLPWSWTWVKLPWMPVPLRVEW